MKKNLIICLSLVFAVLISGCGLIGNLQQNVKTDDLEPLTQAQNNNQSGLVLSPVPPTEPSDEIALEDLAVPDEAEKPSIKSNEIFERYFEPENFTLTVNWSVFAVPLIVGKLGDKMYIEATFEGETFTLIEDDEAYNVLIKSQNKYVEITKEIFENFDPTELFETDIVKIDEVTTGQDDYKEKSFDFEQFEIDEGTQRMLFDGDTLKHIVMMSGENFLNEFEIVSLEVGANDEKFEIPNGYQEGTAFDLMVFIDMF